MNRFFLFLPFLFLACSNPKSLVFEGWAMTMPYKIVIEDEINSTTQRQILDLISFTIQEVHTTYNNWNPESEISRFNQEKKGTFISKNLSKLIEITKNIHTLSKKRFDPTVAPLSMAFHRAYEKSVSYKEATCSVGWELIDLEQNYLSKKDPSLSLDFCGIAKGYFLDLLVERLKDLGIKNMLVEWAGELRAAGKKYAGAWTISLDAKLKPIFLKDEAIATSGKEYSKLDGEENIFHIINPLTKKIMKTSSPLKKVSVKAPTCALADALATAAMTFDSIKEAKVWAKEISEKHPEITFWFF